LKNWESIEEQNHERKQLEEIAHLYFSNSDNTARKVQNKKKKNISIQPHPAAPLFIYCASSSLESSLSCRFLYNLSVMLKILNEQVLFVGSELAFKNRFSFGFRPYRERYNSNGRVDGPGGCYGPMGVCLLSQKDLKRREAGEIESKGQAPLMNNPLPFRFILSDEASPNLSTGILPSLILVFRITRSPKGAFANLMSRMGDDFSPSSGHFGIVVLDSNTAEEAE